MRLSHIIAVYGPSLVSLGNPELVWQDSNGENTKITCHLVKDDNGKWKLVVHPLEDGELPPRDFYGDEH